MPASCDARPPKFPSPSRTRVDHMKSYVLLSLGVAVRRVNRVWFFCGARNEPRYWFHPANVVVGTTSM
jgi:hypothetical protein